MPSRGANTRYTPPQVAELTVSGHVDIDIDQYQAPIDGRKDEYLCKFKASGHFSFQQPNLRKSMWKGQGAPNSSWKSFLVSLAQHSLLIRVA
jgi:hypothetical protein